MLARELAEAIMRMRSIGMADADIARILGILTIPELATAGRSPPGRTADRALIDQLQKAQLTGMCSPRLRKRIAAVAVCDLIDSKEPLAALLAHYPTATAALRKAARHTAIAAITPDPRPTSPARA